MFKKHICNSATDVSGKYHDDGDQSVGRHTRHHGLGYPEMLKTKHYKEPKMVEQSLLTGVLREGVGGSI